MKIIVDYIENKFEQEQPKIHKAKYLSDYVMRIVFNNGTEKVIDFKPFLSQAKHPAIQKYLDEKKFAKFNIVNGNLNWNDYDLIFPILDLYNGKIS